MLERDPKQQTPSPVVETLRSITEGETRYLSLDELWPHKCLGRCRSSNNASVFQQRSDMYAVQCLETHRITKLARHVYDQTK